MSSLTSRCHQHRDVTNRTQINQFIYKLLKIYTVIQTKEASISIDNETSDHENTEDPKSDDSKNEKQKNKTTEKIKNFALGHLDKFIDRETEMKRLSGFG